MSATSEYPKGKIKPGTNTDTAPSVPPNTDWTSPDFYKFTMTTQRDRWAWYHLGVSGAWVGGMGACALKTLGAVFGQYTERMGYGPTIHMGPSITDGIIYACILTAACVCASAGIDIAKSLTKMRAKVSK